MQLSVVIPTLDEEANLARALASLPAGAETIVSDGQSRDRTVELAKRLGARVVNGARGRGAQMNLGARGSTGDVLLFLHADCELGPTAFEAVRSALHDPNVIGGSFRLRIARSGWRYRLVSFGSNLRSRFGLPYGDQAIFVRRRDFEAIGGYPETPVMEDVELVRRLRRRGKLVALDDVVTTGSRHWEALGPIRTTLLNWITISLYFAGVGPSRLAALIHRVKRSRTNEEHSKDSVTGSTDGLRRAGPRSRRDP